MASYIPLLVTNYSTLLIVYGYYNMAQLGYDRYNQIGKLFGVMKAIGGRIKRSLSNDRSPEWTILDNDAMVVLDPDEQRDVIVMFYRDDYVLPTLLDF